ncbi:MAG: hypothetical protein HRT57_05250 [Crocinitomicaceae bacterium]|nr:hypothetical protein [Crocinitomicaceae bacterium]
MKIVHLVIESTDIDPFIEIIKYENAIDYQSSTKNMMVFATERFRLRTTSSQNEMG